MKSRVLHSKIWRDPWFRSLETEEQLYFLYILTNEYVNIMHLYELPDDIASRETGVSANRIKEIRRKFTTDEKIDTYHYYVRILNAYKYQDYRGIKSNYQKLRIILELSDGTRKHFNDYLVQALSDIKEESEESNVTDDKFIKLFRRVLKLFPSISLTIRHDTPLDGGKNTEYRIQNSYKKEEINKEEDVNIEDLPETLGRN